MIRREVRRRARAGGTPPTAPELATLLERMVADFRRPAPLIGRRDLATHARSRRSAGSVALVAGVGDGIGRSCALAFARAGADVVARRPHRTAARRRRRRDHARRRRRRRRAHRHHRRVAGRPARRQPRSTPFGRLDSVVQRGRPRRRPGHRRGPRSRDAPGRLRRSTCSARSALSRAALPPAAGRGGGSITLTSTLSTRTLLARLGAYTSTKQAMVTAAQTMAREVGRDGVRVNVVVPGFVRGADLDDYLDRRRGPAGHGPGHGRGRPPAGERAGHRCPSPTTSPPPCCSWPRRGPVHHRRAARRQRRAVDRLRRSIDGMRIDRGRGRPSIDDDRE